MFFASLPPEVRYHGEDLYAAAGLTAEEVALIPAYIEGEEDFYGTPAFDKLYEYFAFGVREMPYDVMKARTECPDEWILDRLAV